MGNQLVGIAPSQIYPVEHYFSGQFGGEINYDSNMGSTRFFKVVKAKTDEGLIVVKVFVKQDPTLPLEDYRERVEYISKSLENAVNCLPFQRVELTDKAAYLMREFIKHSLYDRVSTRPFLTTLEKKWITFQILCALNQCHKQKICHGDIKLENILITSWNWILLSDFASFKPTYLPEDNPADYTYFFDTSRRRTCYIAPERFVKTLCSEDIDGNISMLPNDSIIRLGPTYSANSLHPAMDIFSTGCALLELWSEGTVPFEFSQLLTYRSGERNLIDKHLQGIENIHLRKMLASMIDLNALHRKSAEDYLAEERGRLFPEYFYSFLQSYLQMFSSIPIMSADEKIIRLYADINYCIKELTKLPSKEDEKSVDNNSETVDNNSEKMQCHSKDQDGLILIITVITSCIRGLKNSNTKKFALEILQKLSTFTTSDTILDRILPYILHLAQTSSANVQVQAIETLTSCLSMVKSIPLSDANIFPEYILPLIADLATEQSSVVVRVAFAKNIAKLSQIAIYFLEETQRNAPKDMPTRRYEAELNALHQIVQQAVSNLLTDPKPIVKQTLIESQICDLCSFFGKEKASDIILSHVMTFLNDDDKNLRGSFYDNIAGIAGFVGWQASDMLVPLLLQGFSDREEYVITKAIRAVKILIELGHIKKPTVIDIIKGAACYMSHPNLWIRHEICGMISKAAQNLNPIDVQCKILPVIEKFMKTKPLQIEKTEIFLDSLHPCIPRQIYDSVLRYQDIHSFIAILEDGEKNKSKNSSALVPQNEDMNQSLRNLFCRLCSEGLNELIEMQLLALKSFLIKLRHKTQHSIDSVSNSGRIMVNSKKVQYHVYPLLDKSKLETKFSEILTPNVVSPPCESKALPSTTMDEVILVSNSSSGVVVSPGQPSAAVSLGDYTLPERNYWRANSSKCWTDLDVLKCKMENRYFRLAISQKGILERQESVYPNNWGLDGTMVAHLHEHCESIIKLVPLKPHGPLFASGSIDGTVRLWDCNKLSGNQGINKSRQVYSANTPVNALTACDGGQSLALGGKDGSLLILRIDRNSSKMTLQQALPYQEDGPVVDMYSYDISFHNLIVYATLYGGIVAYDTRMQTNAWKLQNELRHGVITTICADPTGSWLATGTSSGKHICWDLRFRIPIAEIKHPADSWIRKITCHPTEPACLVSASQSNNEVSVWNIETGHRQSVLWASSAPVLSNTDLNDPATSCGVLGGTVHNSAFIITGSSDQRIRFWNLTNPQNSYLVVPSAKDNLANVSFKYSSRIIDGSQVLVERQISPVGTNELGSLRTLSDEIPRSGPEMPLVSHQDGITDILSCKSDKGQIYIASSARDGVIKLWK